MNTSECWNTGTGKEKYYTLEIVSEEAEKENKGSERACQKRSSVKGGSEWRSWMNG